MSFRLLTDNLIELYVEGHRIKDAEHPQMVANLSGTHLYTEASWLGKAWKWFYRIASCLKFFRPEYANLKQQKLFEAIKHTQEMFHHHYQQVVAAETVYQKAIDERANLREINEGRVHKARGTIKNWHAATSQWFDFIKNKESKGITNWIEQTCAIGRVKGPFAPAVSETSSITCKMVALEGYLQEPIPVNVLLKLAVNHHPLDKIEKETAQKFVKKVNKLKGAISIKDFDDILKTLVDRNKNIYVNTKRLNPLNQYADLATLELALANLGCQIFLQKDKEHLQWRDALKPGYKFIHKGRTLTLGNPIDKKEDPELDRNVVFNVVEDPSIVLVFGINRAIWGIKDKIAEKLSWGLKSVRPIDMDEQRRFAIMPKCQDPLKNIHWESLGPNLTQHDLNLASPMKKLLEWFVGQNKSPINFSSEDLIFSAKGRIKCLKATLEGSFKFNALVQKTIEWANGNKVVYDFISEPLKEHACAKYYTDIVSKSLLKSPEEAAKIAQVHEIYSNDIVEQGKVLREKIITLKGKGERLLNRLKGDSFNAFSEEVNRVILSCYNQRNYLGFLPDSFEQEMLGKLR